MAERVDAPYAASERTMLDAWLDWHRATLALKCDGLSPEQLAERSVPPSTMSLLGLVRHMADVERGWFRRTFLHDGAGYLYWFPDDNRDGDFDDATPNNAEEAFATWRAECARSREIVADAPSLDEASAHPERTHISLRWIMVHMIEEYARHNGHADLLRERIDGATGD